MTVTVRSPTAASGWTDPTAIFSSDDNRAFTKDNGAQLFGDDYGFTEISGETVDKVEVGFEGYGDGNDYVEIQVSWDGGTSWTTVVSYTPPTTEPASPVYSDVTDGRSWTWTELNDANFRVRVTYQKTAKGNYILCDWLPVRVTSSVAAVSVAKGDGLTFVMA